MKYIDETRDLLNSYEIEGQGWAYWVDVEEVANCDNGDEAADLIREQLERAVQESSNVIYYTTAMDFLKTNDPSLRKSMELAHNFGFELKNLNSETLASILNEQMNMEQLNSDLNKFAFQFGGIDDDEGEDEDEED